MANRVYTTMLTAGEFKERLSARGGFNTGGPILLYFYRRYYRCGVDGARTCYIRRIFLIPKKYRLEHLDEHTVRVCGGIPIFGMILAFCILLCLTLAAYFFILHFSNVPELPNPERGSYMGNGIYALILTAGLLFSAAITVLLPLKDVDKFLRKEMSCVPVSKKNTPK